MLRKYYYCMMQSRIKQEAKLNKQQNSSLFIKSYKEPQMRLVPATTSHPHEVATNHLRQK